MDIVYISIIVILVGLLLYGWFVLIPKKKQEAANDIFMLFLAGAWEARVNWFKTLNKFAKQEGTVFIGDSLTNEYLITEMLPDKNVHNRGIGGDTSDGVLKRMKESLYDLNPKRLFLQIGANDLTKADVTKEKVVGNITEICRLAKEFRKDIEINVVSMAPICEKKAPHVDPITVGPRANAFIREINVDLKQMAEEKEYNYIDLYNFLADEDGSLRLDYTREGLHFSTKAYEEITKKLEEIL